MSDEQHVPLQAESDIVTARQRAREFARGLGFGVVDQSRIATAVSELSRNVIRYANGQPGEVLIRRLTAARGAGIEIVVSDAGPGIPDVERAMREGFTTGGGLGMGLPGTKRLMDELRIETGPGQGTTVTIRKWRR